MDKTTEKGKSELTKILYVRESTHRKLVAFCGEVGNPSMTDATTIAVEEFLAKRQTGKS